MTVRAFLLNSLFLTFLFRLLPQSLGVLQQTTKPPRGWNSYDSFSWIISEEEFLQNAELVAKRIRSKGYEYVVVDYLWYRRKVEGAYSDSLGFDVIDEWGRMVPDPDRWPSSRGGKGFTEVAQKIHSMGLKFGIHVMRGISTQAFNANTPILEVATGKAYTESGKHWHAQDIGIKERACAWMPHGFMSVNTKLEAGQAFLRSLYQQYAEWGVDLVKHDCVFGDDFNLDEITYVSEVLQKLDRPILYSLSPGTSATPAMAKNVNGLANMYRITGDDWDKWEHVAAHFDISRDFAAANMTGAEMPYGRSWPDLDMLPLGWLTDPGVNKGPHRRCNLTRDEQRTQMTLWSMAKSPLMFGGDMRHIDKTTLSLITNPTLLEINAFSSNNKEFVPSTTHARVRNHRNLNKQSTLEALSLVMTSCKDDEAKGWSAKVVDDDLEQICWREKSSNNREPYCLYKRKPLLLSDEGVTYKRHYDGKVLLFETQMSEFCLGASTNRKLASEELQRGLFSTCRLHTNQMWELSHDGTLMNSYSGLCASMKKVKAASCGPRFWIATGRKGEIYIAFFNMGNSKATLSVKMSDLANALPGKKITDASCTGKEEWGGKHIGVVKDTLSAPVESHGSALFILNCV